MTKFSEWPKFSELRRAIKAGRPDFYKIWIAGCVIVGSLWLILVGLIIWLLILAIGALS